MSRVFSFLLVAALVMLPTITTTEAADPPIYEPPTYVPEEPCCDGGKWYIRGDVGFGVHGTPDVMQGPALAFREDWASTYSIGVGIGRRLGRHGRVDVTVDHRFESNITEIDTGNFTGSVGLSSTVFLLNAYFDLTEYYGFTPYIGAGIGVAYHDLGKITKNGGPVSVIEGATSWSTAAALMAGVSYEINAGLMLDAGYRYLYLGRAVSGTLTDIGVNTFVTEYNDLVAHEFRVGLRYEMGCGCYQ
ncbi:MAG: porin family protein [Rhizobiales bacterium]|nr:porin family protein [Hyphomicrobiales bacterium]